MAKHVITNAAGISVLELIDNTYKTGGGPVSVGATVVVAPKGPVGRVTQVTASNWQSFFGTPLTKKSTGMEGLRHLYDAVQDCNYVNVVRVVADDATFPYVTFNFYADKGAWATGEDYVAGDKTTLSDGSTEIRCLVAHTSSTEPTAESPGPEWELFDSSFETAADSYGTTLTLGDLDMMIVRPIDGDPSTNRRLKITDVDTTAKRFTLSVVDKDSLGDDYVLESYAVGVNPDDVDDMGAPAYIESVFENNSDILAVDWNDELAWADVVGALQDMESTVGAEQLFAFTGGSNGGEPTVDNKTAAWDLLRNENVAVNLMFAAGEYDTDVLANCIDIADERHCAFFMDAPPYLKHDAAIAWLTDAGLKSRHARCYHAPFSASDRWRGGRTVWGVSGAAAASKARGNAIYTGVIPGIHHSPAGEKRGYLDRTGVSPLFPDDVINRDDLYDARINPVISGNSGGAYIDDDLTLHYQTNYSRFGWVNDIVDYTEQLFLEAAKQVQHDPDQQVQTVMRRLMTEALDGLVSSGAIVTPRDPQGGTEPYILTIWQAEIDLWYIQWDICPVGSARRIAGQPRLIK
jgi:hypothetical protein